MIHDELRAMEEREARLREEITALQRQAMRVSSRPRYRIAIGLTLAIFCGFVSFSYATSKVERQARDIANRDDQDLWEASYKKNNELIACRTNKEQLSSELDNCKNDLREVHQCECPGCCL